MPDIDKKIVDATQRLLTHRSEYYNESIYAGPRDRYYLQFSSTAADRGFTQIISVSGVTLLWWVAGAKVVPHVGLDLTRGDIADSALIYCRDSIAAALEQNGIKFLPASTNALRRVSTDSTSLYKGIELIDRDGMQCCFSYKNRHYISGYDANESPALYFLAELPCAVTSFKEALEALKPESVKRAEELGLSVLRQGDMFFIPTPYGSSDLKKMDATADTQIRTTRLIHVVPPAQLSNYGVTWGRHPFANHPQWLWEDGKQYPIDERGRITVEVQRQRGLYGTAHTAEELAFLPDGTMFARGTVKHDPRAVLGEGRPADHANLKLPGRKWYLVARNTVPVNKRP